MSPGVTLKDIAHESSLFRSRVVAAYTIVVLLFVLLFARLIQLQVLEYRHFQTLSQDNRVKIVPIPPTRGLIFDRNGVVLAQNTPTFSLEVVPEDVNDVEKMLTRMSEIVSLSESDKAEFRQLLAR